MKLQGPGAQGNIEVYEDFLRISKNRFGRSKYTLRANSGRSDDLRTRRLHLYYHSRIPRILTVILPWATILRNMVFQGRVAIQGFEVKASSTEVVAAVGPCPKGIFEPPETVFRYAQKIFIYPSISLSTWPLQLQRAKILDFSPICPHFNKKYLRAQIADFRCFQLKMTGCTSALK